MNSGFSNNTRTLSGVNEINVDKINVDNNISAFTIKGNKGLVGQTIQKGTDNKLKWGFVDDIEIPDGSITGAKLTTDIDIDTSGDIEANTLTADTTLNLPNTTTAINIGGDIGHGVAGQVLAKNSATNKLEWDFVNDITIPDRSIESDKLKLLTILGEVIAQRTIDNEKLILKTITDAEIADNTITTLNIGAQQVTSAEIKNKTITADQIADGTITDDEIHANTITASDKLVTNSITGGLLANDIAITTTGSIQGYEITATHRFIQTGTQINTFAGG